MKRLIVVLSCISIFYAGAVWALEGCLDFGTDVQAAHHADKSAHDSHTAGASHHSHTDPSKIHCPNVFGEFLISPRATLVFDPGHVFQPQFASQLVSQFLSDTIAGGYGAGPPGLAHSKYLPRHLLLSVIRV